MPRFSFVIPNYNYGVFLRECIESCLAQEVDAEILVIDGGSTDNSVEILQSYGDHIRWISEKDNGQSDAINKGVRLAEGEFIAWINSDDYYGHPFAFQQIERFLIEDSSLDILYGGVEYVDSTGSVYRRCMPPADLDSTHFLMAPYTTIVQPGVIFRRSLFSNVGGLDADCHYAMDLDLWLRMLATEPTIQRVDAVIAHARIHGLAKTRRDIRQTIQEVRSVLKRHQLNATLSWRQKLIAWKSQLEVECYWLAVSLGIHRVPE